MKTEKCSTKLLMNGSVLISAGAVGAEMYLYPGIDRRQSTLRSLKLERHHPKRKLVSMRRMPNIQFAVFMVSAVLLDIASVRALTNVVVKDQEDNTIKITPTFSSGTLSGYAGITLPAATSLKITGTFSATATARVGTSTTFQSLTSGSEVTDTTNFAIAVGTNTLYIVHSGDGTYEFTVKRPALTALSVKDDAGNVVILTPSFSPGTLTGYNAFCLITATSLKLTSTFTGTTSAKTGSNTYASLSTGSEVGDTTNFRISPGSNVLYVANSLDGEYQINIKKPIMSALSLTDDTDNSISISPSYTAGVLTGYSAMALRTATSVKVTATFASGTAAARTFSATDFNNQEVSLDSGVAKFDATNLNLDEGANTLAISHSIDGTYSIGIVKPVLSALVLRDQANVGLSISPTYVAGILIGYNVMALSTSTSLKITGTFTSGSLTAKTNSHSAQSIISGIQDADSTNYGLVAGTNTLTLSHTGDGSYVITIIRPALTGLIIKDQNDAVVAITPTFIAGTLTGYTAMSLLSATSLKLTATFATGSVQAKLSGADTFVTLITNTEVVDSTNFAISVGANTLTVVHSVDGSYVINVVKPALTAIVVTDQNENNIAISPSFGAGILTGYSLMTRITATSLKLRATFAYGTVTAKTGNNIPATLTTETLVADTAKLAVSEGANTLLVAHSTDGDYVFTIIKPAISALYLTDQAGSALEINAAPSYVPGVLTGYTIWTKASSTSLIITATFASGASQARTGGNTLTSLSSGSAIGETTNFAIAEGSNTLSIVHSVDGTYVYTVIKPAITAFVIKDQNDETITVNPTYTPGTLTGYTGTTPHTSTSLKLTATFSSGTVQAKTNSNTLQSLSSDSARQDANHFSLVFGSNTLTLVHSIDTTYVFAITKPPMTALSISDQADRAIVLSPAFSGSIVTGYQCISHHQATSLKVTATFAAGATTAVVGSNTPQSLTSGSTSSDTTNFALSQGSNIFSMVHTINAVTGNYVITIAKYEKDLVGLTLKDQSGDIIEMDPAFVSGTGTGYNAMAKSSCTSLKITAIFAYGTVQAKTGSNSLQSLSSGVEKAEATHFAITEGSNTLTVVHSTDGTYVITVIKPALTTFVVKDQSGANINLSPSFEAGVLTGYTATSLSTAESLQLTAGFNSGTVTARTAAASFLNGVYTLLSHQSLTSGVEKSDVANFDLNDGPNTLTVIHSVDGSYVFSIKKPALIAFEIRDQSGTLIELTPIYTSGILSPRSGITPSTSTTLELKATFTSGTTTATLNSYNTVSLTNNAPLVDQTQFVLASGSNSLTIAHSTDGNYSFTLVKPTKEVTDIILKDQNENILTLSPEFISGTLTGYSATTLSTATSLKISASFAFGKAFARTGTNTLLSLTSGVELVNSTSFALVPGTNILEVSHSSDGSYMVHVIKPAITALAITDQNSAAIALSPVFSAGALTGYSAMTLPSATSLVVTATFAVGTLTGTTGSSTVDITTTVPSSSPSNYQVLEGSNTLTLAHSLAGNYVVNVVKPALVALQIVDQNNEAIDITQNGSPFGDSAFTAGKKSYYANAHPTSTSLKLTATFSSGNVHAKTGSNTAQQLTSSVLLADTVNFGLVSGSNTLTVVHSIDGTYSITITKPVAIVAAINLRDQHNNSISFSPGFTSGTLNPGYSGMALSTASSLRVTAEFWKGVATAKTNGNAAQTLVNMWERGDPANFALGYGSNTLTVDHSIDGSYVITVIRPALTSLIINDQESRGIPISPSWTAGVLTGYSGISHHAATSLKITATFLSGTVTAETNAGFNTAQSLTTAVESLDTANFALAIGTNTLSVVHSIEGTYLVSITRPTADLNTLVIKDQSSNDIFLSPSFSPGTMSYAAIALGTATSLKLTATFLHGSLTAKTASYVAQPLSSGAERSDTSNFALAAGSNLLTVIHSIDGMYKITITVPVTDSLCSTLNLCSGHGTCNTESNTCTCIDGYGSPTDISYEPKSPKCDLRVCPAGRAWADVPRASTKAHVKEECSGAGVCDRDRGVCECFAPYTGPACQHKKCYKDCSGHGRCVSMREMARMSNAFPLTCNDTVYEGYEDEHTWDSDMLFGCVCDSTWSVGFGNGQRQLAEWYGRGCEKKRCPSGDDPLTRINDTDCELKSSNGDVAHNHSHYALYGTHAHLHSHPRYFKADNQPFPQNIDYSVGASLGVFVDASGKPLDNGCYGAAGNGCHIECSNRGLCDSTKGTCNCFEGFAGEACERFDVLGNRL
jgi:hypothetical protein